jgi:glycosyltransferase involved in cell wall biosynthesis
VATSVANEGIGATPDAHLLVRDEPRAFADAVVGLLRDSAERGRLGRAARSFVEQHWTWEAHFEQQLQVFRDVAAGRS